MKRYERCLYGIVWKTSMTVVMMMMMMMMMMIIVIIVINLISTLDDLYCIFFGGLTFFTDI